ncbi:hypothetical protein RHSIM_Rhsim08G0166400 [Rhododendron simsii]|uniref:BED-type domain-containing protein n=1 Tax=Rhododendron simsii TaxID=118357 RepID=A0A834LHE0_RHOSS|nr:hypothetical protein RHSIM_Rhsim08G0166400 [Rhododendron simsii]
MNHCFCDRRQPTTHNDDPSKPNDGNCSYLRRRPERHPTTATVLIPSPMTPTTPKDGPTAATTTRSSVKEFNLGFRPKPTVQSRTRLIMSESPVGSSAQSTNPVDGSGPSQPSGSPVPSSSPLDNHASDNPTHPSDNPTDEVEVVSEKSDDNGKRLRSPYWAHYNMVKICGVYKAICNYCGAKISGETRNGTSHLKEHYIRKHQKKDNRRQQVLTNNFMNKDRPPQLTSYSFDHEMAQKQLASAIIMHEYPLSIVEHVGFRRYSNALLPLFKVPCRNTMKAEIFKIYEYQRGKTMSLVVSNASRLAITTDIWTLSNQKKGFMAVTAHFIDESWTLQSRILRFIYVPCPHTKEVLCDQLLNCLMDWNIDRKISNGLDVIKVGIEKIRDSVAYWTASPKREEKFEETVRQLNVTSTKKLGLDCATRWNSTFLMLQTALHYKDVFIRLSKRDAQYNSLPSEREWGFAKDVCQKLNFFFKVTELFSGTKYPTTNQCFPNICEIRLELRDWLHSENQVIREMAKKMVEKFDKYWLVVHGVVGVSAVLDPTYQINVLEFYFKLLFPTSYKEEVEKVRALCYKLLKEYQCPSSGIKGIGDSSSHSSSLDEESLSKYDVYMLRESKRSRTIDTAKLELDHYLSEAVLPKSAGFDVLNWWKSHQPKYPILQAMARDLLAIPVSTVASESALARVVGW